MANPFLRNFRRITSSTSYLPEVDGLRFLAIFSVVVIMHITGYLDQKFYEKSFIRDEYWQHIVTGGGGGVSLFFIISGFILSWPFARWRLLGARKVELKAYYIRRLTRLEPPYVIALLLFFIAQVWVLGRYSFPELLPHFFASVFYCHTLIYHSFSWILPAAWSLEVEVQFYVLAPLFFTIFLIRKQWLRRMICIAVVIISAAYWFDTWTMPHLFKFLHYFFCGILLADLYCTGTVLIRNKTIGFVAGIATLAGYIFISSIDNPVGYMARLFCMFFLFHLVLSNERMKRLFSIEAFTLIGGMCYSIYLLHFAVVSATGMALKEMGFDVFSEMYFLPLVILFSLLVLIVAAVYFLLVEKPFMKKF